MTSILLLAALQSVVPQRETLATTPETERCVQCPLASARERALMGFWESTLSGRSYRKATYQADSQCRERRYPADAGEQYHVRKGRLPR